MVALGFLVFAHGGAVLAFAFGQAVPFWTALAALAGAVLVAAVLAPTDSLGIGRTLIALLAGELLVVAAVGMAAVFFDFGWDGQWYDQNAVLQMASGWNPLRDPLHAFPGDVDMWLHHYAKGPWYVAVALYRWSSDIECAKAASWIAAAASLACVTAAAVGFGVGRARATVLGALAALNPIVTCQLTTFLVDGLVASFLTCHAAAVVAWMRRPTRLTAAAALGSAVLCINTKQTGLVYVCMLTAGAGLYVWMRRRDLLQRLALLQVSALFIGAVVFGYNPYVTNTIHRGNPFFPWIGSASHPGFDRPGQDPNDQYEIPRNLAEHNRLYRLAWSVFGHPGAQPMAGGADARLMWPGSVGPDDLLAFRHHGVRVSGFGPLFSLAICGSALLLAGSLVYGGWPRSVQLLVIGGLLASLLIGPHAWWARYVPQLWWLPLYAILAGLAVPGRPWVHRCAYTLGAVLLLNAALVAGVHLKWEVDSTRALNRQLKFLRTQPSVKADLGWFSVAWTERFNAAAVRFQSCPSLQCPDPMRLMTVAPGYPGTVRVCVHATRSQASTQNEHP